MTSEIGSPLALEVHPVTQERWDDFEKLSGKQGAYGGCWCMWWRISRREFEKQQGEGNWRAMRSIMKSGEAPGILGYLDGEPVGWCSVAPRESFRSLERSPVLKRLDDRPVWSIVCLYVAKSHRGKGVGEALIRGAVEAYPTVARSKRVPPVSSFMGLPEMFARAGFKEQARPSKSKVVMHLEIE